MGDIDFWVFFSISNGLRQGGILSPKLFSVYINDLSDKLVKGECSVFKKKYILWMKTIHYPNTLRSHLVTIVPKAPFTPKFTSKLRSALHFSYSIVIRRSISRANTAQT